jgi:hypothetical protein
MARDPLLFLAGKFVELLILGIQGKVSPLHTVGLPKIGWRSITNSCTPPYSHPANLKTNLG